MPSTTFSPGTVLTSTWLQEVNDHIFGGTEAPFEAQQYDSVADFKANVNITIPIAQVTGYYSVGDGGGGFYWYDSTDTTSSDNGGTILVDVNGYRWKLVDQDHVTIKHFGARSNGTKGYNVAQTGATDNTTFVNNAFAWAVANKKSLRVPGATGAYYCAGQLVITGPIHLYGDGWNESVIKSGFASTGGALSIAPTTGTYITGLYIHDLMISEVTDNQGSTSTHACHLLLSYAANYISNSTIERCWFGGFGGYGLVFDNTIGNADGFFTTTVSRNVIWNGINAISIGDSMNIQENTITDSPARRTNYSGGNVGVRCTGMAGANQLVFRENNITTSGGGLYISGTTQYRITNNQIEFPSYYGLAFAGSTNSAANAMVYITNSQYGVIDGNTINPGSDMFASSNTYGATASSGSNTLTGMYISAGQIVPGCMVAGVGIPAGARVVSVTTGSGTGQVVMTQNATYNGTVPGGVNISTVTGGVPVNNYLTITGNTTNSSTSVTGLSSTTNLRAGQTVNGVGIVRGTRIVSVNTGGSSLVLSQAATATNTGATLSIGLAPDFGIYIVDGGGTSLYNQIENNVITVGNVYHIGTNCASGVAAGQIGFGNIFVNSGFKNVEPLLLDANANLVKFYYSDVNQTKFQRATWGTYTPTISNVSGWTVNPAPASAWSYYVIGDICIIEGIATSSGTASASTNATFQFSLPIYSSSSAVGVLFGYKTDVGGVVPLAGFVDATDIAAGGLVNQVAGNGNTSQDWTIRASYPLT